MPEQLEVGVKDAKRFNREARRRQMQYLGKLMRKIDPEPIQAALAKFDQTSAEYTARQHLLEKWRDRLISENDALTQFLNEYPGADVQHLRQPLERPAESRRRSSPVSVHSRPSRRLTLATDDQLIQFQGGLAHSHRNASPFFTAGSDTRIQR